MNRKGRIVIVGGGLSGLISSILLNREGFEVTVVEQKSYPFHRVCGEYVSNEVIPFLKSLDIDTEEFSPARISRLAISTAGGELFSTSLGLGGFAVSRYTLDHFIYQKASAAGVNFLCGRRATDIQFAENSFSVYLEEGSLAADLVIGAYGKRSKLDQKLSRSFFYKRSPYIGVKYHIKTDFPPDLIQLDIFQGGYCGTVKIEADRYCLCYLSRREKLKQLKNIETLEKEVLFKNPCLKKRFSEAEFLFEKPEVINEISFEQKSLVEDHILYCGDAAGMISPLCGNGMAMAIHGAKILSDSIQKHPDFSIPETRELLEKTYESSWKKAFSTRLMIGRKIQKVFYSTALSSFGIKTLKQFPSLSKYIIGLTHGNGFL
ncbi:NAD(P)/FAD-dependent oxidoreductase [Rubrolithibacter danxiaensis]|uniref:NAD(P)/FAD-dependent oxidoreductase n=1 Tax=Rubrolithibacter danxiaensis TaxID=3390805 RepID=UPI003BF8B24F